MRITLKWEKYHNDAMREYCTNTFNSIEEMNEYIQGIKHYSDAWETHGDCIRKFPMANSFLIHLEGPEASWSMYINEITIDGICVFEAHRFCSKFANNWYNNFMSQYNTKQYGEPNI